MIPINNLFIKLSHYLSNSVNLIVPLFQKEYLIAFLS